MRNCASQCHWKGHGQKLMAQLNAVSYTQFCMIFHIDYDILKYVLCNLAKCNMRNFIEKTKIRKK